jgi:hypothetical protein
MLSLHFFSHRGWSAFARIAGAFLLFHAWCAAADEPKWPSRSVRIVVAQSPAAPRT